MISHHYITVVKPFKQQVPHVPGLPSCRSMLSQEGHQAWPAGHGRHASPSGDGEKMVSNLEVFDGCFRCFLDLDGF